MRDRQQPPLHQHQSAGQLVGIGDLEVRGEVRALLQAERRVVVGAQPAVRVVGDPPGPAQHADVEVEDRPGVAAGEQDRDQRDDRQHDEGQPQEGQHDEVGDREQPLDQPEPPAEVVVELRVDADGIGGWAGWRGHGGAHGPASEGVVAFYSSPSRRTAARCRAQGPRPSGPCVPQAASSSSSGIGTMRTSFARCTGSHAMPAWRAMDASEVAQVRSSGWMLSCPGRA